MILQGEGRLLGLIDFVADLTVAQEQNKDEILNIKSSLSLFFEEVFLISCLEADRDGRRRRSRGRYMLGKTTQVSF